MSDHLFVYGSLRSDIDLTGLPSEAARARARLTQAATPLGPATIPGRLYAISWYPGLIAGNGAIVTGEIWRIDQGSTSLAKLDAYEGDAYRRELLEVHTATGASLSAWVYVYDAPINHAPVIDSGDYAHWIAQQTP